jgi:hypothetical protein
MRDKYARIGEIAHEEEAGGDELHGTREEDHRKAVACAVDEDSGGDLGDYGYSLDAEGVGVDLRLGEAFLVIFQPQEEHALEREGFEHAAENGETGKNVAVSLLVHASRSLVRCPSGLAYIFGDISTRLMRLRISMLCPSAFFGGNRLRANFFSSTLRYGEVVDSGRLGNVSYPSISVRLWPSMESGTLTKPNAATGKPIKPSSRQRLAHGSETFGVASLHTYEEHPLPALEPTFPFHSLVHGRHHDTREHATHLANGCEDGCSFRDLRWFTKRHVSRNAFRLSWPALWS